MRTELFPIEASNVRLLESYKQLTPKTHIQQIFSDILNAIDNNMKYIRCKNLTMGEVAQLDQHGYKIIVESNDSYIVTWSLVIDVKDYENE